MAEVTNIADSFHLRIKTLYDIEKQLEEALPKMAEAATNDELAAGFRAHLEETKEHSKRLEEIFALIEKTPEKHAGEAIRGLVTDGDALASADAPNEVKDVLLAGAGRDVEHFEMACYMNAIEEAKGLELTEAVELLETTLREEVAADEKLESAFKENLTVAMEM